MPSSAGRVTATDWTTEPQSTQSKQQQLMVEQQQQKQVRFSASLCGSAVIVPDNVREER
jgi:hypothetical protein